jgi:leader peptidase (prepilin peptidase)/N-methyltransferase
MLVAAAAIGLILGSFLNALLFRYNTGRSVMHGRSACMRCGHTLCALDLVPVLSFVFLRGRCRYCGAKISWQYPLVELVAAVLAVATFVLNPEPLWFAYWFAVWMALLFITVYDLRHKIIPWSASLTLLGLALIYALFFGTWLGAVWALPLFLLSAVSKGTWMGWGDGLLELSLGLLLGFTAGLTALFAAFWAGAFVGIALIALRRGVTIKSEVPFAPFLIAGAALAYFLHADLFTTLPLLWL